MSLDPSSVLTSVMILAAVALLTVALVAAACVMIVWLVPEQDRHRVIRDLPDLVRAFGRRRQ